MTMPICAAASVIMTTAVPAPVQPPHRHARLSGSVINSDVGARRLVTSRLYYQRRPTPQRDQKTLKFKFSEGVVDF